MHGGLKGSPAQRRSLAAPGMPSKPGRPGRSDARGTACLGRAQVLPKSVPSPLTAFSWEDVQAIEVRCPAWGCRLGIALGAGLRLRLRSLPHSRPAACGHLATRPHFAQPTDRPPPPVFLSRQYQPMLRALEHATWLASSAAQQPGGSRFGREEWDRALSVRSFFSCQGPRDELPGSRTAACPCPWQRRQRPAQV